MVMKCRWYEYYMHMCPVGTEFSTTPIPGVGVGVDVGRGAGAGAGAVYVGGAAARLPGIWIRS